MNKTYEDGITEGQNRVLWHLLCIGDENVAHDHWHLDKAQFLFETRMDIVRRLEANAPCYPSLGDSYPSKYPNFKTYSYSPG